MVYLFPVIVLLLLGIAGFFVGIFSGRRGAYAFALTGAAVCAVSAAVVLWILFRVQSVGAPAMDMLPAFLQKTYAPDPFALFFAVIALAACGLTMLMSADLVRTRMDNGAELLGMVALCALAMVSLASARELITLYLSFEFLSITGYIMVGFLRNDVRSTEASLKYFFYGAVSAAVMLFGLSLLYAATKTTDLAGIAMSLNGGGVTAAGVQIPARDLANPVVLTGILFIIAGFGYKTALVPFHMWSPDVYEGAPTPVTAFLSVGPKAAGFAVFLRVFFLSLTPEVPSIPWQPVIIGISIATMTLGNLAAMRQTNLKRLLAYSSIAQAGYIVMGLAVVGYSDLALAAVLFYLVAYLFTNVGAFAVVEAVNQEVEGQRGELMPAYNGLARRAPWLAAAWVFFGLSLVGIPPTIGFVGKFLVFVAVIQQGLYALAVIAVLNSVASLYYYFEVARRMFFAAPETEGPLATGGATKWAVGLSAAATVGLLFAFGPLYDWVSAAREMLVVALR